MHFALRRLRTRPAFALLAIATLALGIGAPIAIFSVVRGVLLRPLPYPNPGRIVRFEMHDGAMAFDAVPVSILSDWLATTGTLAEVAVFNDRAMTLTTASGPYRIDGAAVTPNLFSLLGVPPAIGRVFDDAAASREIVLSDAAWRTYFAADRSIVGQPAIFDGQTYRVAGVMPATFSYPTPEAAFWVAQDLTAGGGRGLLLPAIARLRDGASLTDAVAEGTKIVAGPNGTRRTRIGARTLQDQMVGGVRRLLWLLMGSVALVFLIATSNIALLLLTDGHSRQREFAVRLAIGASRGRLVRQLLAEGATLACLGGIAGVATAAGMLRVFVAMAPASMPRSAEVVLDTPVLLFALAATAVTSVLFGLLSAGRAVAFDALRVLAGSNETRLNAGGGSRRRLQLLAAAEIALAMVLVTGASLLVRSFITLATVPQGFTAGGATALQVNMPAARYPGFGARLIFMDRLLERIRSLNGVASAGIATAMPNRQPTGRFSFTTADAPEPPGPFSNSAFDARYVTEGFIESLGVPLVEGRTFRREDGAGAERAVVLSATMAHQLFPDGHVTGQLIYSQEASLRVIGVVGDVRPISAATNQKGAAYLPMRQLDSPEHFDWWSTATVIVRGGSAVTPSALRGAVLALDPAMPPFNVRTLDEEVSRLVAEPRFNATLLSAFGFVALVLATLGIYGVMSHAASQRTREIGVRLALGAAPARMLLLVLREGASIVTAGVVTGAVAAFWLTRSLTGLLYEVRPADPFAIAGVAMLLAATGLVASFIPARRAARVNALLSLRAD